MNSYRLNCCGAAAQRAQLDRRADHLWATDEMGGDFGAGDTDFTLAGGDLEFTYRRTY
ncbi:MAG: hypothetical protein AAF830_13385 [Pseudomonadota bacterium]